MQYLSVTEIAKKWNVSERSVRNYCAQGRVNGAFLTGKTWNIPENAKKPERTKQRLYLFITRGRALFFAHLQFAISISLRTGGISALLATIVFVRSGCFHEEKLIPFTVWILAFFIHFPISHIEDREI